MPKLSTALSALWRPRVVIGICMVFAGFNALAWAITTPPGGGHDEAAYLEVSTFIQKEGRWPIFDQDPGFTVRPIEFGQGLPVYPYLPYNDRLGMSMFIAAQTMKLPTDSDWTDIRQSRAPGAIYAALTVFFVCLAIGQIFPLRPYLMVFAAALTAYWPQMTAVHSVLNDDGYTVPAMAALIWAWWGGMRNEWSWKWCIAAGIALGAVVLGKPNAYPVAALSALVAIATVSGPLGHWMKRVGVVIASALVVCGWRLAIAYHYYGFDIFNSGRKAELLEKLNAQAYGAKLAGHSFIDVLLLKSPQMPLDQGFFLPTVARRYFAALTAHKVPVAGWQYYVMGVLLALVVTQILLSAWSSKASWRFLAQTREGRLAVITFGAIPLLILGLAYSAWAKDYILAGLLLFPVFVPVMAAFVWGLDKVPRTVGRKRVLMIGAVGVVASANWWGHRNMRILFDAPISAWEGHWQYWYYLLSMGLGVLAFMAFAGWAFRINLAGSISADSKV